MYVQGILTGFQKVTDCCATWNYVFDITQTVCFVQTWDCRYVKCEKKVRAVRPKRANYQL